MLSANSSSALGPSVHSMLETLRQLSHSDSTILLKFIETIVAGAFSFDMHLSHGQSFMFCELLITAAVNGATTGHVMESSTVAMVLLLSRCFEEALHREDIQQGAFQLCCRYSFAGKEKVIFLTVSELISCESWHELDITKAAIEITCALLTINLRFDDAFLLQFAMRLSEVFREFANRENKESRHNLLELAFLLADTFAPDSEEIAAHGSVRNSARMEKIFVNLNDHGEFVQFLKNGLLTADLNIMLSSARIINVCCDASSSIAEVYAREDIAEYLFEVLRQSHIRGCTNSKNCSIAESALRCIDAIRKRSPNSLESRWEYGLDNILNVTQTCVKVDVELIGVRIIKDAIRFVPSNILSAASVSKKVLDFVLSSTIRYRHQMEVCTKRLEYSSVIYTQREDAPQPSTDLQNPIRHSLDFLNSFLTVVKLNFECISKLVDICEIVALVGEDYECMLTLILSLLDQLSQLRLDDEQQCAIEKLRTKVLYIVFNKIGVMVANKVREASEDLENNTRLARDAIDYLEIFQSSLNSSFLFKSQDSAGWNSVFIWCWQAIDPGAILVLGSNMNANENNEANEQRKNIIRDYICLLLNGTEEVIRKTDIETIPTNLVDFENSLLSNNETASSKTSMLLIQKSLDMQKVKVHKWVDVAIQGLASNAHNNLTPLDDEENFVRCICMYFRLLQDVKESKPQLKLSTAKWLILLRSVFFNVRANIHVFFHLAANSDCVNVRYLLWEKFAAQKKGNSNVIDTCAAHIHEFLSSEKSALEGLYEVAITQKVSQELLNIVLSCFRNIECDDFDPVVAMRKFEMKDKLVQSLKTYSFATRIGAKQKINTKEQHNPIIEEHQVAGLLIMAADSLKDWSDDELFCLCESCCDFLRRMHKSAQENEPIILPVILRFLIRVFEKHEYGSHSALRALTVRYPVYTSIGKILKMRAERSQRQDNHNGWYVAANAACLMMLMIDFLSASSDNSELAKLYEQLPKSCVEWANLVCTLPSMPKNTLGSTCSAINCTTLFRALLESSFKQNWLDEEGSQILRISLITSSVSQNVMLRHTALLAFVALEEGKKIKQMKSSKLHIERSLFLSILTKLHNSDSSMLYAEAVYVNARIEENSDLIEKVFSCDTDFTIEPTYDPENNPFGIRIPDIDYLKRNITQYIPTAQVENIPRDALNVMPTKADTNRRILIFGQFAVIMCSSAIDNSSL